MPREDFTFKLELGSKHSTVKDKGDVADLLEGIASRLRRLSDVGRYDAGQIKDALGITVGKWEYRAK